MLCPCGKYVSAYNLEINMFCLSGKHVHTYNLKINMVCPYGKYVCLQLKDKHALPIW